MYEPTKYMFICYFGYQIVTRNHVSQLIVSTNLKNVNAINKTQKVGEISVGSSYSCKFHWSVVFILYEVLKLWCTHLFNHFAY